MAPKLHTDRKYETELQTVRNRILLMAGHVEQMIGASVKALSERDPELARQTIALDAKVNAAEVETDELCLVILAKRQPMASDLRFVTLAMKMVTDLERMGDLAVNICERAIDLSQAPPLSPYEDIHRMADLVQSMVKDAIDAFVDRSVEKAERVIASDDEVDALYDRVFTEVLAVMRADADAINRGIHVQSVAKWLERMADHSTNLAEQVIFMIGGTDVRHAGKLAEARSAERG
jgi:phosphate transport system protein